ncbi:hypothetical protein ACFQFQ_25645 [Sulfitobacter porphyrae]|uniref:ABC transporter permease n=1 Tax=Sulfitobacter porphyrae TaxID=1246864 RepID=A0ABW2B866_9RHOB
MTALRRVTPQLLTLAALVALITLFFPDFLRIEVINGRLVGTTMDILKRGAPIGLLAVGMTLVIATRGIDLSVGTTMAITGAIAAWSITQGYGLGAR